MENIVDDSMKKNATSDQNIAVYMMTHGPECQCLKKYIIPMELDGYKRDNCRYPVRDNIGDDNISEKGAQYNEITGLYWMWKHDAHDIVGLCHYRRIFRLSDKRIKKILSKYDFIMPKQYWRDLHPSMEEHYKRVHSASDWELMKTVMIDMYPEYYASAEKVMKGQFIFGLNMFIAHKAMMDAYCEWLFPLLLEIEKGINLDDGRSEYNKRAIGILCERLFTIYILHNVFQKDIKIKKIRVYDIHNYFQLKSSIIPKFILKIINSNDYLLTYYNCFTRWVSALRR